MLAIGAIEVVFLPLSRAYDVEVFLRAGRAVLHGLPVYPQPGSGAVFSGSSFVYPYLTVLPFVPLAAFTSHAGVVVFFIISVWAVVAACTAGTRRDPYLAVLVLCTSFTITGLQLGALSPLLFAGAAFLWRLRDRPVGFALLAAAVVTSKLFLAPLLVWPLLAGRRRAFAYATASTAALLGAGFVLGPLSPASYLHLLSQLGAHEARAGFGLIGALMNAGLATGAAEASAFALGAIIVGASYVHWRRARDERVLFCAGVTAALLATPVLWSHYLVLAAAALLGADAPRRWFVALALASWTIAPPHGVDPSTAGTKGTFSLGAWLAVLLSLAVFGYAAAPRRRGLYGTASVPRRKRTLAGDSS